MNMNQQENQMVPFAFGDSMVRVRMDENGNPWWVAKDVAVILGLQNIRQNLAELDDAEKITVSTTDGNPRAGIPHQYALVSESGLYALVFRSRKPEAKAFSKWVRSEVLPALRKNGRYELPGTATKTPMSAYLQSLLEEALHLRPHVRSKLLWCAMKAAEMDNTGTEGVMNNFMAFCHLVGETPDNPEGQLLAFVEECLETQVGARSQASRIYSALRFWWRQKGKGVLPSEKALSRILDSRFAKKKVSVITYIDCAIRTEWRRSANLSREGAAM